MSILKKKWFIVLTLFIFPPLGLFLLYKHKPFSNRAMKVLAIISVLILIFILIPTGDDEESEVANNDDSIEASEDIRESDDEANQEENVEIEEPDKDESENTEEPEQEEKEEKITGIEAIKSTDEEITLNNLKEMVNTIYPNDTIELQDFADEDYIVIRKVDQPIFDPDRDMVRRYTLAILQGMNKKYNDFPKDKYYIVVQLPGVDKFGNETYIQAAVFTIRSENIRQLNYDNIFTMGYLDRLDATCENAVYFAGL